MGLASALAGLAGSALSFIGGRQNRKAQQAMHAQDSYNNSPQGIRANAEEAGFNPLTVLTSGRSFGAGYAPVFGNEYAALGQGIQDFVDGLSAEKAQVSKLEQENARLQKLVQRNTLTPPVPGVYGARNAEQSDVIPTEKRRTEETFVTGGGNEIDVPLGPDVDELVLGQVIDRYADYRHVKERTRFNKRGLGDWKNPMAVGPSRRPRVFGYEYVQQWDPKLNKPLRGYYGPPGSRTGF